eukprot:scaffold16728_cov137-Isochrysis_galbana.AAC.1
MSLRRLRRPASDSHSPASGSPPAACTCAPPGSSPRRPNFPPEPARGRVRPGYRPPYRTPRSSLMHWAGGAF